MNNLLFITVLAVGICWASASFNDEMDALEKAMDAESQQTTTTMEKAVKDLSTEELIRELEIEVKNEKRTAPVPTISKKEDIEKKFRKRFEQIIEKKSKLDELMNADVKSIFKKEVVHDRVDELITAMADAGTKDKKNVKRVANKVDCVDVRTDCGLLKAYCVSHKNKLKDLCEKTCGFCAPCVDTIDPKVCKVLSDYRKCRDTEQMERMTKLCPQTCGFCASPAPPKCSSTKHGCCWDKVTTKNKDGKNCPACTDTFKNVCKTFKADCVSFYKPGDFMRRMCPKQCNLCNGTCVDDKEKIRMCPFWQKQLGWCTKKETMMKHYCPVTCKFC